MKVKNKNKILPTGGKLEFFLGREINWQLFWDWGFFWTKSYNDFLQELKRSCLATKFWNPMKQFKNAKLAPFQNSHNGTFELLYRISNFLRLNNFFLNPMKKSLNGFVQKVLSLLSSYPVVEGHRQGVRYLTRYPFYILPPVMQSFGTWTRH